MNQTLQTVIVAVVIILAVAWVIAKTIRRGSKSSPCCGCDMAGSCCKAKTDGKDRGVNPRNSGAKPCDRN